MDAARWLRLYSSDECVDRAGRSADQSARVTPLVPTTFFGGGSDVDGLAVLNVHEDDDRPAWLLHQILLSCEDSSQQGG